MHELCCRPLALTSTLPHSLAPGLLCGATQNADGTPTHRVLHAPLLELLTVLRACSDLRADHCRETKVPLRHRYRTGDRQCSAQQGAVVPSPWLHTQMIATLHRSELTAEAVRTPARGPVADGAASWASKWKLLKRTLLLSAFLAALPHWFPVRVCYRPRDDRAVLTRWV